MSWINALVALGLSSFAMLSCDADSGCEAGTVDRALAFLDAHQSCETNADCAVVSDFCGELPGGFCGQLAISREGAESAEWKAIEQRLRECSSSSCVVCDAALVPTCKSGFCR